MTGVRLKSKPSVLSGRESRLLMTTWEFLAWSEWYWMDQSMKVNFSGLTLIFLALFFLRNLKLRAHFIWPMRTTRKHVLCQLLLQIGWRWVLIERKGRVTWNSLKIPLSKIGEIWISNFMRERSKPWDYETTCKWKSRILNRDLFLCFPIVPSNAMSNNEVGSTTHLITLLFTVDTAWKLEWKWILFHSLLGKIFSFEEVLCVF